jgi:acetyltransferase
MDRLPSFVTAAPALLGAASGASTFPFAGSWLLRDGTPVVIRAAGPQDGPLMQELVRGLSATSRYQRFFYPLRELPPGTLARFVRADPLHDMSLLAVIEQDGHEIVVGMAQYVADDAHFSCEFALVVADAWQRKGIAARLLQNLMGVARSAGLKRMEGEVLADNHAMRALLDKLGFAFGPHLDGAYLRRTWRGLTTPSWKSSQFSMQLPRTSSELPSVSH